MFPQLFFVNKIEGNGEAGSRSVQNRLQELLGFNCLIVTIKLCYHEEMRTKYPLSTQSKVANVKQCYQNIGIVLFN